VTRKKNSFFNNKTNRAVTGTTIFATKNFVRKDGKKGRKEERNREWRSGGEKERLKMEGAGKGERRPGGK
jgi:hypothetical protein